MAAPWIELEKKCRLKGDAEACKGLAWAFLKACEREDEPDSHACVSLADMYAAGVGVARADERRSAELHLRACTLGNVRGCFAAGSRLAGGIGVEKDEVAAAVAFAQSCRRGHPTACHRLARAYAEGRGVPRSRKKAVAVFDLACDMGSTASCESAGALYLHGVGVERSTEAARARLRRACAAGSASACGMLAGMDTDAEGKGVP
jgi:TPR repeat protein